MLGLASCLFFCATIIAVRSGTNEIQSSENLQDKLVEAQFRYQGKSYQNRFDRPLHFECNAKNGEALNQVRSAFHHHYRDRVWSWGCSRVASVPLTDCSWTNYINRWQGAIRFMCPKGKVMVGVDSKHWNSKEDRRWKIKCCSAKGYHTQECELTKNLNNGKSYFEHKASPASNHKKCSKNRHRSDNGKEVFVGLVSNWRANDRNWQMIECDFEKDNTHHDRKDDRSKDRSRDRSSSRRHGTSHCKDCTRSRGHRSRDHSKGCDGGMCHNKKDERTRDKSRDKSHDKSRDRSHDKSRSKSHDHKSRSKSDNSRHKTRHSTRNGRRCDSCSKHY